MAKIGDRGGRRFESSGLSRAEVLLGLAENASTQAEEETLKELHEQEIFWGEKESEEKGFGSDVFGIVQTRSKNYRGKPNFFPHRRNRSGEFSTYHSYESAPVNVPHWSRNKTSQGFLDEHDEDDEMVVRPPHELVAGYNTSFSVIEGYGRTLKGRDLRKVRDAVLRQTGFLD